MGLISILLLNDESYLKDKDSTIRYITENSEKTYFIFYGIDRIINNYVGNFIKVDTIFPELNKLLKLNRYNDIFILDLAIKPKKNDFLNVFKAAAIKHNSMITGTLLFNAHQNRKESNFIYSLGTNLLNRLGYFNIRARSGIGGAEIITHQNNEYSIESVDYLFVFIPEGLLNKGVLFDEMFPYYLVKSIVVDAFYFSNNLLGVKTILVTKIAGVVNYNDIAYIYPPKLQELFIAYWNNKFGYDISNPDYIKIREMFGNTDFVKKIKQDLICDIGENPGVDALIVTMNNGERLKITLEKLLASDYSCIKIYVYNNASNDCTKLLLDEFCNKYKNIFVINSPVNIGIPSALNWLFAVSNSPVVLRIDDDVDIEKNTITDLLNSLKLTPYAGIASPKIIAINSSGRNVQYAGVYGLYPKPEEDILSDIYLTRIAGGPILMYKRDVINKVGVWDIQYSPSQIEDIEHAFRVFFAGYDIIYNGKIVTYHMDKGEEYISLTKVVRASNLLKIFGESYGFTGQEFNRFVYQ